MFDEINDKSSAFDAAIGLYVWLSENYNGMGDEKYAAMSKIVGEYKLVHKSGLDEMSEMFYNELTEENWEECFEKYCHFMENEWDNED